MALFDFLGGNKKIDRNEAQVQRAPGQAAPGIGGAFSKLFDKNEKEVARIRPIVEKISSYAAAYKAMTDDELKLKSQELKDRFQARVTELLARQKEESGAPMEWQDLAGQLDWTDAYHAARREAEKAVLDELLPEAFALTREAGDRTIGLRHFDVQMIGGAVLHSGRIGEMRTGEGKTLVATLPAYLNALSGRGVHVITVNDYLAERDANWMRPIYEFLGLSVSFLTNDMESAQRVPAYAADIMYATNSEVGFDYLRDNMAREADDVVQRPLNFAIVDEVDNILIDEARTPLIISAQVAKSDRALRRQQMASTCNGLARKLVPAVTDREVDILKDSLSSRGGIDLDGLMNEIRKRGAFEEATAYLVDAYLLSEQSARLDTAARLLDVANELQTNKLIDDAGAAFLVDEATRSVDAKKLAAAWGGEVSRLAQPFAEAFAAGVVSDGDAQALAYYLSLGEDAAAALETELAQASNKREAVARAISNEIERRKLVDNGASVAAHLLGSTVEFDRTQRAPQLAAPAQENAIANPVESTNALANVQADAGDEGFEADAEAILVAAQKALVESLSGTPGAIQRADAILSASLPETAHATADETHEVARALEEISGLGLPFETTERLWEAVRLPHRADALREQLADTIVAHAGEGAKQIETVVAAHSIERAGWLAQHSAALKEVSPKVAELAARGESATELRRALQTELGKSGAFADAMKVVKSFVNDGGKANDAIAAKLVEEMSEWVETPTTARKNLAMIIGEGGKTDDVRENLLGAIRDLPGDNSELPALSADAARAVAQWRLENAPVFIDNLTSKLELPEESRRAFLDAIEDGEHAANFDQFAGEQLLASPQISARRESVEQFSASWDEFRATQNDGLLEAINNAVAFGPDLREALEETLDAPHNAKELHAAIIADFASDTVSRHLEPLLTDENAGAFAEEIQRRIPLAKDTARRIKPADFVGRSGEQLRRAIVRLVEKSFAAMPIEDFRRAIKNLGWLSEKDEKRRTAALTDMGTLIAEREAAASVFTDPDGFLETLIGSEILTDEEGAMIRRAQEENAEESLTSIIDRTLRLPAARRRRLAEAKLQEVQSVLDQSIKAHALFHREVHYVVDNGKEIVIVDEFTGRKMPGRRFSEGLHEALEAKQGLEVQLESQTVATITIQNYFRLYNKLAGMTGTAKTEEQEFAKTYGIEVVSIPTNKQICRKDFPDVVYKTTEAKFRAITFDVLEHHCAGQPVLLGTRSVEVSEQTSERLKATPLQMLVLQHIIKQKMWDDKAMSAEQKQEISAGLNAPVVRLNPAAIKNVAKQLGVNPDPLADENLNLILGLFTTSNPSKERLATALKNGLAHNVLNAKNHRNEARIVAEAARPANVTIATNMAGRGVDIVLGGTLDVESRWRVMTLQTLARTLEGKTVHIRSRNEDTTTKFIERISPEPLQSLAWVSALGARVHQLELTKEIEGLVAKDLRDTLAGELTASDLKNRVRSRVRRYNLAEKLGIDDEPTSDATLDLLNIELQRLMNRTYDRAALKTALETGIAAQSSGRDQTEEILLHALARPLAYSKNACEALVNALESTVDFDRTLLQAAIDSGASEFDATALANKVGDVTETWAQARLNKFDVKDAASARAALDRLPTDTIETNELALLKEMGDASMGPQWLRERLNEWGVMSDLTAYDATPEMQQQLGDTAVVHGRLNGAKAKELIEAWRAGGEAQRALVSVEAPNLVILGDIAQMVGEDAPFLHPEWLHYAIANVGIVGENDVMEAQMMAQAQDEQGNVEDTPVDVLVYRIRLNAALEALKPSLREIARRNNGDAQKSTVEFNGTFPWANEFVDEAWITHSLANLGDISTNSEATVVIETGVAGQSSDITLEGEARPEDIAHTSEGEEVKSFGGLHIIGSERHESRRIDNQLRGRAGRQGDPGSSRFYVSLEDELWRLFGVRNSWMLSKWEEDEAVEHSWITKSVERAQKKVELNHFEGRKHTLQFDDVMNVQREVIYRERRRALQGADVRDTTLDMARRAAIAELEKHCPREIRFEEWDTHKAYLQLGRLLGSQTLHRHLKAEHLEGAKWIPVSTGAMGEDIFDLQLSDDQTIYEVVEAMYDDKEKALGTDYLRSIERWQVTRSIDEYWMEHLAAMDYLRDAIWQESYAQKEPIGVYRQEGFAMFQKMLSEIRREVTEALFAWQTQDAEELEENAALPMGELHEARLISDFPMDDDDLEDGEQLMKDADGEEPELVYAGSVGAAVASPKLARGPQSREPQAPMSRAERRAAEKNSKKNR